MSEEAVSKDTGAKRLERLQMRSGCSLGIAAPCLIYAATAFSSGHPASGRFVLIVAAVLVALYLITVCFIFEDDFVDSGIPCGIISVLLVLLLPVFLQATAKREALDCLVNVRYADQALRIYAQDYDNVTPLADPSYTTLIAPYLEDHRAFTCPLDPKGTVSYTFNSNIAGMPIKAFTSPDKTVLIYEGNAGKLNYRHNGRASVGFVDGRCKLISAAKASSLIWMVRVPKAK